MYSAKYYTCIGILLLFSFTGCWGGPTYTPPKIPYQYNTNTQQSHILTGITIKCPAERWDAVNQLIGLTKNYQIWYIDGRKVLTQQIEQDAETFIQLPPGDHELILQRCWRGLLTLGTKQNDGGIKRLVFEFTLEEGAKAIFELPHYYSHNPTFTGIVSYTDKTE